MKYTVIVRPEAEEDLKGAFSWYEDTRVGLGNDFLLQVDAGLNFIKRNPEIHPIEYKGTRKHLIKRFPYKIIYLVKAEKIIVLAVLHGKRKPDLTKKRINSI
ncbi:MAG: type II toxin-antitoxin system RelE/ParE family toxin [Candidatus Marinimicrobia bacterium]|nr:type II toxin-antitoxin system RelE/ParE family toxin [Candidatus Neomarinimicrobiota bacterium]